MRSQKRILFENGQVFSGYGFGAEQEAVAEVVFNTSMAGYQEILSDPTYSGLMVLMTYPLIGAYGMADEDYESRLPHLSGLVVREYNDKPSNYRYTRTLGDFMQEHGVPGIEGVDTRMITRMLRREGGLRALLTGAETPVEEGLLRIRETPAPGGLVGRVSCKKIWHARTTNARCSVVAVDLGIKQSIIQSMTARGCNVDVVPYTATIGEVLGLRPDGVLLAGGPGDPKDAPEPLALVKALQGRLPLLGIGLGHQVIALANGIATCRLPCIHYGGNHPVKELETGRVFSTAQSHGFVVDRAALCGTPFFVTHEDLVDGVVEGIASESLGVLSVMFQPEGAPGPRDGEGLFDRFTALMVERKGEVSHA